MKVQIDPPEMKPRPTYFIQLVAKQETRIRIDPHFKEGNLIISGQIQIIKGPRQSSILVPVVFPHRIIG